MPQIKLLVEGGNMVPGPALSQKIGPMGVNMGMVIQKINEATKNFKGLKVPVELDIDAGTKEFVIKVASPPVPELLKKEFGLEKASGEQLKMYSANASIEQIISIAKTKLPSMLCRDLKAAVKSIVGTCASLGILIENKPAKEVEKQIDSGKFDREIQEEKTETSQEKKQKLERYFKEIHTKQEKLKAQEAAAKEAEETKVAEETKPEEEAVEKIAEQTAKSEEIEKK